MAFMAEEIESVLYSEFPRARGALSYFDTDSATLVPTSALRALTQFYEWGALSYTELEESMREEKERLATTLKARRADSVLLYPSVQDAVSAIASAFSKTRRKAVTISAFEHEVLVKAWLREMSQRSINIRVVVPRDDGSFSADSFASAIDEDTAAVLVSHIVDVFGVELPISTISKLAREHGAPLIVDLTHSCFRADIGPVIESADVTLLPSHNAFGPSGLVVCTLGDRARERLESMPMGERPVLNWRSESRLLPILSSMNAGLDVLKRLGFDAIRRKEVELTKAFFDLTSGLEGLVLYGPKDPKVKAGLVCFNLDDLAPKEVSLALEVGADAITFCGDLELPWAQQALKGFGGSANRLSLYVYNNEEEVKMISDAISKLPRLRMG